jgi:outer membrane lipoprotein-sorting protein
VLRTLRGEGGKMRLELPGGRLVIGDGARQITLDPAKKVATRIELIGLATTAPAAAAVAAPTGIDLVAGLKNVASGKTESLGEQTIGGVVAVGFRAPWSGTGSMTVWADKRTAQPLRIELTMQMAGRPVTSVMENFELDPAIDDGTFSTDLPPGYTLETQKVDVTLATQGEVAEAVAAVLRAYADKSGGDLPADLNDWAALMRSDEKGKPAVDPALIGGMSGQLFSLPGGYGYAGKGLKVGDREKVVFWYRPANATTYRAVLGDLTIADVAADRIPATQPVN